MNKLTLRSSTTGFTLIELMVALVAGLIAITAVYFLSSTTTRQFQAQNRIAQTQSSLRMAMEQIRNDVARAGYGAAPVAQNERRCRNTVNFNGVETISGADTAALPNAAENGVQADRLRLIASYDTADRFLLDSIGIGGNTLTFQTSWQGFRRSFGVAGVDYSADAFEAVFRVQRLLHIETPAGHHFFVRILSSDGASGTVTFTPSLATSLGTPCIAGVGRGSTVFALSRIEYAVVDPQTVGYLSPLVPTNPQAGNLGLTPSVLVRREIRFTNATPINRTERLVMEYAANFVIQGVFNTQAVPNAPPIWTRNNSLATQNSLGGNAGALRTLDVTLSARTAEQDPRFPWVAPQVGAPLGRYRVNPALPGAARVRTMRQEIHLPNFTRNR